MRLFDAFAVVAYLADEPAADEVDDLLADRSDQNAISAANLAEVFDDLVRVRTHDPGAAAESVMLVRLGGLDVLFVDDMIAERAGRLRGRHYNRSRAALSMADCIALATASGEAATLVTGDRALIEAARAEGVAVVQLADRRGRRS